MQIERWEDMSVHEQGADEREVQAQLADERDGFEMQDGGTDHAQIFLLALQLGRVSLSFERHQRT